MTGGEKLLQTNVSLCLSESDDHRQKCVSRGLLSAEEQSIVFLVGGGTLLFSPLLLLTTKIAQPLYLSQKQPCLTIIDDVMAAMHNSVFIV